MPDDSLMTPISMQAAGVAQPPSDPESLISLLRSQGSMPAEAMQMLQAPSAGQGYAAALSGGISAMRGQQDPVAQLQAQQQSQQMQQARMLGQAQQQQSQQQMQQLTFLQRMQSQKQMMEFRKAAAILPIYEKLITSDSPEGRIVGARGIEGILKSQGQQVSPGFAESFATKLPSLDKRKEAYMAVLSAQGEPSLQAGLDKYLVDKLQIPADMLPMVKQEAISPMTHKLLFGKTPQQEILEVQKADLEQKKYDVMLRRQDVQESRAVAAEARAAEQTAEGRKRLDQADRRLAIAESNQALSEKKFEYMQAKGPEEKRLKALDMADQFINQFDATAHALQKTGGYLPDPNMSKLNPRYLAMVGNRKLFPYNEDWKFLTTELKTRIAGYARSVQNDIGFRAIAAIQGALSVMDDPPDIKSLEKIIANMRQEVQVSREGKDTAINLYINHNGAIRKVPWSRDLRILEGDSVVKVE